MARAVNLVWNYCGDVQNQSRRWSRRWPTGFDLCKLAAGASREGLPVGSDVFQAVCKEFAKSRDKANRRPRWRKSVGSKRSLGWVPFMAASRSIRINGDTVTFQKRNYRLWLHRPIGENILCGSFSEDARGRWYLNLQCEITETQACGSGAVGVDLGLKTLATLSTGETIANPRHFAAYEKRLAAAQRVGRKARVKAIHAKIKNARRHWHHVVSVQLARRYETIVVGNVNSSGLAKTRMAKSVLDAGWSQLRGFLAYKAIRHRGCYIEVSERFSTQTCFACHTREGPKGLEGLGVRSWTCSCGVVHDRDVNAALNILASGQSVAPQLTGIPSTQGGENVTAAAL